jgi:hypothetical protein
MPAYSRFSMTAQWAAAASAKQANSLARFVALARRMMRRSARSALPASYAALASASSWASAASCSLALAPGVSGALAICCGSGYGENRRDPPVVNLAELRLWLADEGQDVVVEVEFKPCVELAVDPGFDLRVQCVILIETPVVLRRTITAGGR